jgi:hypothetical protein
MGRRCIWCNGSEGVVVERSAAIVDRFGTNATPQAFWTHAEHEVPMRDFVASANANARTVVIGIAVALLAILLGSVAVALAGEGGRLLGIAAGVGTMAIGALLVRWPFATPETVSLLGVRRSMTMVRVLAMGVVILGVVMVFLD